MEDRRRVHLGDGRTRAAEATGLEFLAHFSWGPAGMVQTGFMEHP